MTKVLKKFITDVNAINEIDYGDFMRKANHYFIELQDQLHANSSDSIQSTLFQIKLHLQYTPNWNVESTRRYLLQEIKLLDSYIQ